MIRKYLSLNGEIKFNTGNILVIKFKKETNMFKYESLNITKDVKKLGDPNELIKLNLKVQFMMTDDVMKEMGIPKIELKYEDKVFPEIWTYCKFDKDHKQYNKKRKYIISTYGRIYDVQRKTLMKPYNSSMRASTATGGRYQVINIRLDKNYAVVKSIHRLVALAFLKKVKRKDVVDHIDENPTHNWVWNLQWTDKSGNANKHNMFVARERTGKAVDTRWKYEEIVAICKMMAKGHKATYIYHKMLELTNNDPKIQYERIRTLYKHIVRRGDFHDIAKKCGVSFVSNTLKEKGSVQQVKDNKSNNK